MSNLVYVGGAGFPCQKLCTNSSSLHLCTEKLVTVIAMTRLNWNSIWRNVIFATFFTVILCNGFLRALRHKSISLSFR